MSEVDDRIIRYYDLLGDGEWQRLVRTRRGQVSFEVHRRILSEFIRPSDRVLEVGAGAGRFTAELATLGASIVVTDVSQVQLDLNRQHMLEAQRQASVEAWHLLDVRDTSLFSNDEFDAVVAYGGSLSYAFEQVGPALSGLLRVGHIVLASVMSSLGSWRFFLSDILDERAAFGSDVMDQVFRTGDLRVQRPTIRHPCQMFRWREVQRLVASCGGVLRAASASNWTSMTDETLLESVAAIPEEWSTFIESEVVACREAGALDGGTHIIFAASREG